MEQQNEGVPKRIAIIGGGPSGLFMYKRLLERGDSGISVEIFESKQHLGSGMPYSHLGASPEHVTNVSGNEIPELFMPLVEWLEIQPKDKLEGFGVDIARFNEYKVLPRLLFGEYLGAQFASLEKEGARRGIATQVHTGRTVTDITDVPDRSKVIVEIDGNQRKEFDSAVICSGHNWPVTHEGKVPGYFDSPYPPSKLQENFDHEIAIRGASLTAIDAIRTLARQHGRFIERAPHVVSYEADGAFPDFKIVMHSRHGLLPAVRFHLEDPRLSKSSLLSDTEIAQHRKGNDGFLSLDFIFEKDFKETFKEKDRVLYEAIKNMSMEEFVGTMMAMRERADPFRFFKMEYEEAKASIRHERSVYWKEALAILSFAMNYPAKHLSAEDMQRLQNTLMPLISLVIAFVPQSSCEELIALHDAGKLELIAVGEDSKVTPAENGGIVFGYVDSDGIEREKKYRAFIDATGQKHLSLESFPFKGLVSVGTVSPARLRYRDAAKGKADFEKNGGDVELDNGVFYLKVPGIAITDSFRVVTASGLPSQRLHIMAVPYIGGYNPDYSGLDFCEEASKIIADDLFATKDDGNDPAL